MNNIFVNKIMVDPHENNDADTIQLVGPNFNTQTQLLNDNSVNDLLQKTPIQQHEEQMDEKLKNVNTDLREYMKNKSVDNFGVLLFSLNNIAISIEWFTKTYPTYNNIIRYSREYNYIILILANNLNIETNERLINDVYRDIIDLYNKQKQEQNFADIRQQNKKINKSNTSCCIIS